MDIKRGNGDKGIDYFVNDSKLDLSQLEDKRIIVLGERHRNSSDENLVKRLIKKFSPSFVLVEALGDYKLHSLSTKKRYLKMDEDKHYYGAFTKHWIEISLKFDIPFIGIDYTKWKRGEFESLSLKETFKIREDHFIKMIEQYAKEGSVIAICGDTHMRTIETEQLGQVSPLYTKYNNGNGSCVIRSAEGEIE